MMKIDLRSDTVTKPTEAMLQAMVNAKVGDDVYGEDAAVNELQAYAASLFNKDAALFCPSGTMANQIAIKVHTRPGNELICADNAHVYKYEGGGVASNSGVQLKLLPSIFGKIDASQIANAINADDIHFPASKLVCLENTSNRGGGSCYKLQEMQAIHQACKANHLSLHLDGARIFNAILHEKYSASQVGDCFDTISICLSKGLGAPVGSLLLGTTEFIKQAKRVRKVFGGGMRQAGFLAAAGLYALNHHINRLSVDHANALQLLQLLQSVSWIKSVYPVATNIVIFELKSVKDADKLHAYLIENTILCGKISPDSLRMVFHLDITEEMVAILLASLLKFKV